MFAFHVLTGFIRLGYAFGRAIAIAAAICAALSFYERQHIHHPDGSNGTDGIERLLGVVGHYVSWSAKNVGGRLLATARACAGDLEVRLNNGDPRGMCARATHANLLPHPTLPSQRRRVQ